MVLERAPRLRCDIAPVEQWLTGPPLQWLADDVDGPADLPLQELSQAQKRWADIAITAALVEFTASGGRAVMLLDEPEQALHSLAVRTMARGLEQLSQIIGVDILTATHAAALLDSSEAQLLHVTRDGGGATRVHRLDGLDEEALERFGMTKADLLQLTRVFVVVEGLHDQVVLEETCSLELRQARARMIAMRGVAHAPSLLDAQFLLRFTDSCFLVVMDAVEPTVVDQTWAKAQDIWRSTRDLDQVHAELKAHLPALNSAENKYLRELMLSSIGAGQGHRVRFQTLPAPDVIYYLPIESFTSSGGSWRELADEHQKSGTKKNFKTWLTNARGLSFEEDDIRNAARRLDHLHEDVVAVGRAVLDAAQRS